MPLSNSQLGSVDAVPGSQFTYGQTPSFGTSVVVTAFSSISFTASGDVNKIFNDYTPTPAPHILFSQNAGREIVFALGLIDRLLLEAVTFDVTDDIVAGDRSVVRYLRRQDSGTFPPDGQPLSAIQQTNGYSGIPISGTWDLVFTMQDGSTVVVENDFDDDINDIQTNIDTAMAGQILGYTAGDIQVSGDVLEDTDVITGQIISYGGSVAPTGYVACDGASYATTTYPDLFSVIGYTYGGSGANFNVPDTRGRSLMGLGTGAGLTARTIGDSGGVEAISQVPPHSHNVKCDGSGSFTSENPAGLYLAENSASNSMYSSSQDSNMNSGMVDTAGTNIAGANVETSSPFVVINHLIKT